MNWRRGIIRSPRRRAASSVGGTVRPSVLAVLRLMIELELRRLLDRQVGRLLALENSAGVDAGLTVSIVQIGSVAHQAAARRTREHR